MWPGGSIAKEGRPRGGPENGGQKVTLEGQGLIDWGIVGTVKPDGAELGVYYRRTGGFVGHVASRDQLEAGKLLKKGC